MTRRGYGQVCAAATALDAVGERWALLVVRDLLLGPLRYGDLMAGLPGISTSVLAARLSELEAAGVVRRRLLDQPGTVVVYELTSRGAELEPVVLALAVWGAKQPGCGRSGRPGRPTVAGLRLRDRLRETRRADWPSAEVELWVGQWPLTVSLGADPGVRHGVAEAACATVRLDAPTFYGLLRADADWPGQAAVGDAAAVAVLRQALQDCAAAA